MDDYPISARATQSAARQLISSLVGLPELAMRVAWLGERVEGRVDERTAGQLDQVAAWSQLPHEHARESMLALAVLFARQRDSSWLWALHQTAKQHGLLHLERALRPSAGGGAPISAAELPTPDYGGGRVLSVGQRRTLARRPTRAVLEKLLNDPHPLVMRQLLQAKCLTEEHVMVLVTRRPAHCPTLDELLGSPRWIVRRRVRLSLILNPGTPHGMALPFVTTCPKEDLGLILEATTINATLRTVARELYLRLPPLQSEIQLDGVH